MKLTIDISREDYSDFNKFHFMNTKLKQTILYGVLLVIVLEYLLNRNEFNLTATIISSIGCLGVFWWAINRSLNKTKNIPDNDGTILGQKEMEFGDDKITYTTKNSQGTCEWASVKYLKESPKAFYLYMDANMAMLVPKRTFGTEDELEEFRNIINKKVTPLT